jgi:SlyX protein
MSETRLVDIETKLAYQEHALLELNDVVARQQATLAGLEARCDALLERIRALGEALPASDPGTEKPPHY